jgi:biotin transporter BioY
MLSTTILLAIGIGGVYVMGVVVMALFWSYIPPRRFFSEALLGLIWPATLIIMAISALLVSSVRAVLDQKGEFAGLSKDAEWCERRRREKV